MPANSTNTVYELPLPEERAAAVPVAGRAQSLDVPLLYENIRWFCSLRWSVIAVITVYGLMDWTGTLSSHLELRRSNNWPFLISGILLAANLFFLRHARSKAPARALHNLWSQIVLDLLMLTIVVHYVGSQVTYVGFAYLFHIVLACVFLPRRHSLLVTGMAATLYILCITSEILGWVEPSSLFVQPTPTGSTAIQVGSALGIWVVIWYLVSHLSRIVRERDFTFAQTNQRLEAALVERSQHMLHTTHELKSPFAAIHLNAQLLLEGAYGALSDQATEVVERMVARCKRLSREIQDMLQLANLQSIGQGATNAVGQIDLKELLEWILYRFNIIAQERKVTLQKDLQSASVIMVDDHLHMLIENLLSNAIFYSRLGGTVSVTCRAGDQGCHVLTIQDEGIGIASEKLPHVFEDYYRAKEAVKHYTESSGLGLAIVRHIAQINRIRVRVESQLGVGTQFVLYFPMIDRTHHRQS